MRCADQLGQRVEKMKEDQRGRAGCRVGAVNMIQEGQIFHVSYVESMEERLHRLDLLPDPRLGFEFHLVKVPVGEEEWKIDYLQFYYRRILIDWDASHHL